jgi:hypothetical protein
VADHSLAVTCGVSAPRLDEIRRTEGKVDTISRTEPGGSTSDGNHRASCGARQQSPGPVHRRDIVTIEHPVLAPLDGSERCDARGRL